MTVTDKTEANRFRKALPPGVTLKSHYIGLVMTSGMYLVNLILEENRRSLRIL